MIATLFAFAIVTAHVAAEIPSYIHVCGRKDPNYDQCITDNINNIKDKICSGMSEFNILPIEPIIIDKIIIYDTDNLKLSVKDIKINGFCDFVVNFVHTDSEKLHFNFDVLFKHLFMNATYDFDVRVLVSLANKGLIYIFSDNVSGKINLDLNVVTKDGKKYIYASKANTNLNIKTYDYKFDDSEKNMVELHKILSDTIKQNEKEIFDKIIPALEEKVSTIIIPLFNNITYSKYEELFPEEV
ncbi:uncharacterized protein LOC105423224 [Pogonomyrmex barbatus]|uniref:Uncharacterized protein LOC105423224 n=1 Tax=Pogonomyrmex barbatus TaxID=144034 RepID=A0A6I9VTI0_9HYME|nr:uncharacterized protein LOC105423224 [Pogonomyrmex barbatus]